MAYTYLLKFRGSSYFPGDDGEGSRRAGVTSDERSEQFQAETDDEALGKACRILQEKCYEHQGRKYPASPISLHKVLDISFMTSTAR